MSPVKNIQLRKTSHRQQDVVLIAFDSDPKLTGTVKQQAGARWSQTLKSWYIPEKQFDLHHFFETFKGKAWVDYSGSKSNSTPAREKIKQKKETTRQNIQLPPGYLERLQQERYSENTIKIYTHYFKDFVNEFSGRDLILLYQIKFSYNICQYPLVFFDV